MAKKKAKKKTKEAAKNKFRGRSTFKPAKTRLFIKPFKGEGKGGSLGIPLAVAGPSRSPAGGGSAGNAENGDGATRSESKDH